MVKKEGSYVRVRLHGVELWCLPKVLELGCADALAPLDHVTPDGELNLLTAFAGDSYAHVFPNGEIKRYGALIGHRSDLERIDV